tara:strand:+ start:84 stop:278 length:195 start_codon:yes stop_codon:yes gene_type:complete
MDAVITLDFKLSTKVKEADGAHRYGCGDVAWLAPRTVIALDSQGVEMFDTELTLCQSCAEGVFE